MLAVDICIMLTTLCVRRFYNHHKDNSICNKNIQIIPCSKGICDLTKWQIFRNYITWLRQRTQHVLLWCFLYWKRKHCSISLADLFHVNPNYYLNYILSMFISYVYFVCGLNFVWLCAWECFVLDRVHVTFLPYPILFIFEIKYV